MANCRNHPGVIATGRCAGCAEEFCQNCLVDVQGQQYCGACKVMALQGKTPAAAMAAQERGQVPNKAAKEALTWAIVGFFCFGFIVGPIAIVKAVKARKEIAQNPNLAGEGMALAALIIAIIGTVLNYLVLIMRVASIAGK